MELERYNVRSEAIDMLVQFEREGLVESLLLLVGESAYESIP